MSMLTRPPPGTLLNPDVQAALFFTPPSQPIGTIGWPDPERWEKINPKAAPCQYLDLTIRRPSQGRQPPRAWDTPIAACFETRWGWGLRLKRTQNDTVSTKQRWAGSLYPLAPDGRKYKRVYRQTDQPGHTPSGKERIEAWQNSCERPPTLRPGCNTHACPCIRETNGRLDADAPNPGRTDKASSVKGKAHRNAHRSLNNNDSRP